MRLFFRNSHPGIQNDPDNGTCYDKNKKAYICPTCTRAVCQKQRNSIYFSYHILKCTGKVHPVSRQNLSKVMIFGRLQVIQKLLLTKSNLKLKSLNFRTCELCNQTHTSYNSYRHHIETKCGTKQFVCHVCGMVSFFVAPLYLLTYLLLIFLHLSFSCSIFGYVLNLKLIQDLIQGWFDLFPYHCLFHILKILLRHGKLRKCISSFFTRFQK